MSLPRAVFWAGVAVLGGVAVMGAVEFVRMSTGNANMDALRPLVLWWSLVRGVDPLVMMGILHEESKGDPANFLGDIGNALAGGLSIGPFQVSRASAIAYGLYDPDTDGDYATLSGDTSRMVDWGCQVMRHKLDEQGGDVAAAIKAYNGSGPAADAYQARVTSYLQTQFGVTV